MNDPQKMVAEFHAAIGGVESPMGMHNLLLRAKLIEEEAAEAVAELRYAGYGDPSASRTKVAKELADVLYVAYGSAVDLSIDLQRVFEEVHRSNMTKVGGPVRADGKVMKGDEYQPPDLSFVEDSHGAST